MQLYYNHIIVAFQLYYGHNVQQEVFSMAQPKNSTPSYESLTVRFPVGMLARMRALSDAHDRSLNAEIVRAVRIWLQRQETDDATDDGSPLVLALASG